MYKGIEFFDGGGVSGGNTELAPYPINDEKSQTSQNFCRKANVIKYQLGEPKRRIPEIDADGEAYRFYPKDDSLYGYYNPIWFILSMMNVGLEMFLDLFSVFTWFFKLVLKAQLIP